MIYPMDIHMCSPVPCPAPHLLLFFLFALSLISPSRAIPPADAHACLFAAIWYYFTYTCTCAAAPHTALYHALLLLPPSPLASVTSSVPTDHPIPLFISPPSAVILFILINMLWFSPLLLLLFFPACLLFLFLLGPLLVLLLFRLRLPVLVFIYILLIRMTQS